MTQVDNLIKYIPNLLQGHTLDVGCGDGKFTLDVLSRGGEITSVEPHTERVLSLRNKIKIMGKSAQVFESGAERMAFLSDDEFDFINVCEVIEHVVEPEACLKEIYRVLRLGGKIYISVPNRYGYYDWHFHLYFINWLPRFWAEQVVTFLDKTLTPQNANKQRLSDMHYMTRSGFIRLANFIGFEVADTRIIKIREKINNPILRVGAVYLYKIVSFLFLGNFHFILKKIVR